MTKFFLTILLSAFLVSCELFLNELLDIDTPLGSDQFYAIDFKKDIFYKVKATKLYEGKKCLIWAENGSKITEKTAKEIADKYDNVIRPRTVDAFGMKNFPYAGENFKDILDYANWLAGKDDRKLTILLLDIKDSFNGTTNQSYTAGYFYSGNFYDQVNSNRCDMIFVDTYPALQLKPEDTYATFAHELQHLINYATTTLKRKDSKGNLSPMDTWIDEGLSSQAEYLYYGKNLEDRCKHFYEDTYGTIAEGNNFFVWGNHVTNDKPMPILDDYSTVYLFFRWLYLQAADKGLQSNIFIDIETSNLSDHRIITNAATKIRPEEWTDWDTLLRSWLAANYYPKNSVYGYKGDSYLQDKIKVNPIKKSNNRISLAPGEGVYSNINMPFTPQAGGQNICYGGLSSDSSSDIVTQGPFDSDVLLTYNANTNNSKLTMSETGYLTGVSANVSSTPGSRTATEDAQTEKYTGPYVIDARDYNSGGILGRDK